MAAAKIATRHLISFKGRHQHQCEECAHVEDHDNLIDGTEAAAADIVPMQPVAIRDSIQRCCEVCVQGEGGHFKQLL
jgi:hypothetical protein